MKRRLKDLPLKTLSMLITISAWLAASVLMLYFFWSVRARAGMRMNNENEQILTMIMSHFRSTDDLNYMLEHNNLLKGKVLGAAMYGADYKALYRWGAAAENLNPGMLGKARPVGFGRYILPGAIGSTVRFILHNNPDKTFHSFHRPPPPPDSTSTQGRDFFNLLLQENYLYLEVEQKGYWRVLIVTTILFPLVEAGLFFLCLYVRLLFLRNRQYQEQLEAQKNLVVVGTAASTLAHEIKNPLLAIRLQTGILQKMYPEQGVDEIKAINEEVDRLTSMTYRVNDYLRDAAGEKQPLDVTDVLASVFQRLTGRELQSEGGAMPHLVVNMDEQRLRSVLENLLRNALESGSAPGEVRAAVRKNGAKAELSILDRGKGIREEHLARIFDPFFSSKSRGTGIGLAVSKRFVEAAGGKISIMNRDGGGVEAVIALPLYEEE
jgi:two-component system sensor histidine kinase HydH